MEVALRWVVHGTDVVTGERVSLGVSQGEATEAVQAAMSRRMVVTRVTRARWPSVVMMGACAGIVLLGAACGVLWRGERQERGVVAARGVEIERLRAAMAGQPGGVPPESTAAAAGEKVRRLEQELNVARAEGAGRREVEATVTALRQKLAAAEVEKGRLATEAAAAARGGAEAAARVQAATEQAAALAEKNTAAAAEVEVLKGELLVAAAARPSMAVEGKTESEGAVEEGVAKRPVPWALKVGYGAASEFVAMHFEKDSMATAMLADGEIEWTATAGANAARVRVVYDKPKEKVFAATLSVGLATDGPAGKVAENRELVEAFLKAFSPGVKEEWVGRAILQLAGRDAAERMVMVAEDAKVSVWNNGEGLYTWKVESVGNEME